MRRWLHERTRQNIDVSFHVNRCDGVKNWGWGVKANEFVKKFGFDAAKAQLGLVFELHPKHKFDLHDVEMFGCNVDVLELKQFVDNYELIDSYGGFHSAINTLKLLESSLQIGLDHGLQVDAVTEIPKLKQAIADMGSMGKIS